MATTAAIKAAAIIPDVIVNNAGIGRWLFIEETPLEELQAIMTVPYLAAFAVMRAFIAEMPQRGRGDISNVNSPPPGSLAPARSLTRRRDGRFAASPRRCGSTCAAPA